MTLVDPPADDHAESMYWSSNELQRRPEAAMIGGVCAGLARYFELDVSIVRALFIATTIFGGFGVAVYVALWVLVEPADIGSPEIEDADDASALDESDSDPASDTAGATERYTASDAASATGVASAGASGSGVDEMPDSSEFNELSQNPVRVGPPSI